MLLCRKFCELNNVGLLVAFGRSHITPKLPGRLWSRHFFYRLHNTEYKKCHFISYFMLISQTVLKIYRTFENWHGKKINEVCKTQYLCRYVLLIFCFKYIVSIETAVEVVCPILAVFHHYNKIKMVERILRRGSQKKLKLIPFLWINISQQ